MRFFDQHSSRPGRSSTSRSLRGVSSVALLLWANFSATAQLVTTGNFEFRQIDFADTEELNDRFGEVLASGDFNGDGYDDLAIGTPLEDVSTLVDAGTVYVVYGTASGLGIGVVQTFHQASLGMKDLAEAGDLFGAALAAGDFNGDGRDDLAVGVPGEDAAVGNVHIIYGSPSGLDAIAIAPDTTQDLVLDQSLGGPGTMEAGDAYGTALTAADFDADEFDDLAVGVPGEDADTGEVNVYYGGPGGLIISQQVVDLDGIAQDGDRFGSSFSTARFFGDIDELQVGAPGRDSFSVDDTGGVAYFLSMQDVGITTRNGVVTYPPLGTNSGAGVAMAAGNFDGDDGDEHVIAVPQALASTSPRVLSIKPFNVTTTWQQGTDGLGETLESFDNFGEALTVGDFNGDGKDDLAIGAPGENLNDGTLELELDAGVVHAIYGSDTGLTAEGNQVWSLDTPGIDYGAAANDEFGAALASGDFNGDGADDLAIGVPDANVGALDAGLVYIIQGFPSFVFGDGFESGNTSAWSSSTP